MCWDYPRTGYDFGTTETFCRCHNTSDFILSFYPITKKCSCVSLAVAVAKRLDGLWQMRCRWIRLYRESEAIVTCTGRCWRHTAWNRTPLRSHTGYTPGRSPAPSGPVRRGRTCRRSLLADTRTYQPQGRIAPCQTRRRRMLKDNIYRTIFHNNMVISSSHLFDKKYDNKTFLFLKKYL